MSRYLNEDETGDAGLFSTAATPGTRGSAPDALASKGQYLQFHHLISGQSVSFHAFLTNFEDVFTSEWNEEPVFGRMDPLSTFKRTGRKINLGWKVVAEDHDGAIINLRKVSALIRFLYPSYQSGGQSSTHIAGPPLLKLRFMNLARDVNQADGAFGDDSYGSVDVAETGLLGYVDGFTNKPVLEDGFVEDYVRESTAPGESVGHGLYPKTIELGCTFTVLHTHDLGFDQYGVWKTNSEFPYSNRPNQAQIDNFVRGMNRMVGSAAQGDEGINDSDMAEMQARADDLLSRGNLGAVDLGVVTGMQEGLSGDGPGEGS